MARGLCAGRSRLILVGVCGLAGCGGDPAASNAAPSDDGGAPDSGSPSRPACPNPPIPEGELQNRASGPSVFGIVTGGDPGWVDVLGGTECGVAGVLICQRGTGTCTESDEAGQFVLGGLPENQDIEIVFEKSGSTKMLRPVHTGAVPINLRQTRLISAEGVRELLLSAGVAVDDAKGALVGGAIAAGESIGGIILPEGVVMALEPAGPRPLYTIGSRLDGLSSDELDPTLEATRFGGWGVFANVEPGDYTIRFERNGQVCSEALPGFGYGADAEGNVRVKVVPGYSTGFIAAFCP